MRNLTTSQKAAIYASQVSAYFPILIRVDHASLANPLYYVNNTENVAYGGNTYVAYSFRFDPPDQAEGGITNAKLVLDDTLGVLIQLIRSMTSAPTITTIAAMVDSAVEKLMEWTFTVKGVTADGQSVTLDLVYDERGDNDMGPLEMTAFNTPGIF